MRLYACVCRHESWRDFKAKEAIRTLPLRSASPVDECSSALLVFPLLLLDRFVATSEAPGRDRSGGGWGGCCCR